MTLERTESMVAFRSSALAADGAKAVGTGDAAPVTSGVGVGAAAAAIAVPTALSACGGTTAFMLGADGDDFPGVATCGGPAATTAAVFSRAGGSVARELRALSSAPASSRAVGDDIMVIAVSAAPRAGAVAAR